MKQIKKVEEMNMEEKINKNFDVTNTIKSAIIIVNPIAGKKISCDNILKLTEILKKLDYKFKVYYTKAKKDATNVILEEGKDYKFIICCGGDGTFHEVVNGVMKSKEHLPILCVPFGTTNDLAKSLGASSSLDHISKSISCHKIINLDVGCFNKEEYFSYVASFGAFCEVAYKTSQKLKNIFGYVAYIFEGFRFLQKKKIRSYYLNVKCNEEQFEGSFIFGAITNSKSVAGLIDFTGQNTKMDDGEFEIILIRKPENPMQLIKILLNLRKRKYNAENIIFRQAKNVFINSHTEMPWILDGEYAGDFSNINIENICKGMEVMKGNN
ncbi:MAG: Diacylglycerol kinase [Eubacteriales bacterium SKADARSKE-1]|nr:Diacylglycerol kinase [Eubacteriales bacterium SKADARSKE-1]